MSQNRSLAVMQQRSEPHDSLDDFIKSRRPAQPCRLILKENSREIPQEARRG